MENPVIDNITQIIITSIGFVITISLATIAFFIKKYFIAFENRINNLELESDERHNSVLKQIAQIESTSREHSILIKSNKEIFETNINSIKEQIKDVKLSIERGINELKEELKNKK